MKDVPAKSGAEASEESTIKKDPSAEAPAAGTVDSDKAKATDGIDTGTGGTCTADSGTGNVPSEGEPAGSLAGVHSAGV